MDSRNGRLDSDLEQRLIGLCRRLIDQRQARVVVPPEANQPGFWFGGGNIARGADGCLYLVGRYRNAGDSRTGLSAGMRGWKLSIFRWPHVRDTPERILDFCKEDLSCGGHDVLSIEGSAIRFDSSGVELVVSTEKKGVRYPEPYGNYLKPGTGIWSVDRIRASSVDQLDDAEVLPWLDSADPSTVHIKDPFWYESESERWLLFCSHPFSWTSSGTGYLKLLDDWEVQERRAQLPVFDFFRRGNVWDVAMSRGTCLVDVPGCGEFANRRVRLMFYDGGECVRDLDQHAKSVERPRGYSCEELGGVAYSVDGRWDRWWRLSELEPMFVSPWGTGCSRYVDVFRDHDGLIATWQQSQPDRSQPLVVNHISDDEIEALLV